MILLLLGLALALATPKNCVQNKELFVDTKELSRMGDKNPTGLKLSNLLVCTELLNGKYDRKNDKCEITVEVCHHR